jgi:hypothetical protein
VPVRRRLRHRVHADHAAGAGAVLDDHRLAAQVRRQRGREQARRRVHRAAGREGDDEAHRPVGEAQLLRRGAARAGQSRR